VVPYLSTMKAFLFRPVDIASLVFFRITFGILGFADVLNTWLLYHLQYGAYDPDGFRFHYTGLNGCVRLGSR